MCHIQTSYNKYLLITPRITHVKVAVQIPLSIAMVQLEWDVLNQNVCNVWPSFVTPAEFGNRKWSIFPSHVQHRKTYNLFRFSSHTQEKIKKIKENKNA